MTILHITLATGSTRMSPRSEVSGSVIDAVRAAMATGEEINGWSVEIEPTDADRVWHFILRHEGRAIVTCLLCDSDALSSALWEAIQPLIPTGVLITPPELTPWLAVGLADHPAMANPAIFADVLMEAADLERIVAWILME